MYNLCTISYDILTSWDGANLFRSSISHGLSICGGFSVQFVVQQVHDKFRDIRDTWNMILNVLRRYRGALQRYCMVLVVCHMNNDDERLKKKQLNVYSLEQPILTCYKHGRAWRFEIRGWRFGNPCLKKVANMGKICIRSTHSDFLRHSWSFLSIVWLMRFFRYVRTM